MEARACSVVPFHAARLDDAAGRPPLPGEVHVWRIRHSAQARALPLDSLCNAEQARADRLLRPAHRATLLLAHALRREVLGRYLNRSPSTLAFETAPGGKPRLRDGALSFNLSHAGDAALLVVAAPDTPVGIDLEDAARPLDLHLLAQACLAPDERPPFDVLTGPPRAAALRQLWTRKEALLKAQGTGLARDPRELVLGFDASSPVADQGTAWTLADLDLGPGWHGAVAVRGVVDGFRGMCLGW